METPCGEDDEYSTDSGDYEGETHNDEFVDPSQGVIAVANNLLDCGCDVKWLIVDLQVSILQL